MIWDMTQDWDLSPQAAYRRGDGHGSYAVGVEVGYRLMPNLWLSAGHNFTGFDDAALAGNDYLNSGSFLRVRFKFDEDLLQ
jgi:hypothetical protein